MSAFGFLFSEIVQYTQAKVNRISAFEERLQEMGRPVGARTLELITFRERGVKRETRLENMLHFISGAIWKSLFGKIADGLEKVTGKGGQYYIKEKTPIVSEYISLPRELEHLHVQAFVSGILEGILEAANFPAEVETHYWKPEESTERPFAFYLIKFSDEVVRRERGMT